MGFEEVRKEAAAKAKRLADSSQARRLKQEVGEAAVAARRLAGEALEGVGEGASRKVSDIKEQRAERKEANEVVDRAKELRQKALRKRPSRFGSTAGAAAMGVVGEPVLGSVWYLHHRFLKHDEKKQKQLRADAGISEVEWKAYKKQVQGGAKAAAELAEAERRERKAQKKQLKDAERPLREAEKQEEQQRKHEAEVEEIKKAWALIKEETGPQ
jgi:hypothetical protein